MRQHLVLLAALAVSATACADSSVPTGPSLPIPTPVFAFAPGDSVVAPPDTAVVPGDSVVFPPDTVVVPGDTVIIVPGDTIAAPGDSVVVPGDSVVAPAPWFGFVTGGGFIASPAGAYAADARLVGKATFGFNVKSKEGRPVPEGNVEFQFHGARFDFKGHDMETLSVVGSKATWTGPGTLNGVAGYSYAVTVVDGRVDGERTDRFRIRIWNRATGAVAYDSQVSGDRAVGAIPTTALASGSVVIHAK